MSAGPAAAQHSNIGSRPLTAEPASTLNCCSPGAWLHFFQALSLPGLVGVMGSLDTVEQGCSDLSRVTRCTA